MSFLRRFFLLSIGLALVGCGPTAAPPSATDAGDLIRIGAVFPLGGSAGELAGYELRGVQIAVDLANADGGVGGRRLKLEVRDLRSGADASGVMASLRQSGVQVVIGAYGSDLSIAASQAADAAGLVYWESGAVADRLTGRGLPMVFRVGASGSNLGSNSASFAALGATSTRKSLLASAGEATVLSRSCAIASSGRPSG